MWSETTDSSQLNLCNERNIGHVFFSSVVTVKQELLVRRQYYLVKWLGPTQFSSLHFCNERIIGYVFTEFTYLNFCNERNMGYVFFSSVVTAKPELLVRRQYYLVEWLGSTQFSSLRFCNEKIIGYVFFRSVATAQPESRA